MGLRGPKAKPVIDRLMAKIIQADDPNSCWAWNGTTHKFGYGKIGIPGRGNVDAHRLAYQLLIGDIPAGLCVRHKCDNPPCCNPRHLELGTIAQNNRDTQERDGHHRGENHARAKLTDDAVRLIRRQSLEGYSQATIARMHGVAPMTINHILLGKKWAHVLDDPTAPPVVFNPKLKYQNQRDRKKATR